MNFLLSELPGSAYECVESESGEFLDDEIVGFHLRLFYKFRPERAARFERAARRVFRHD